MLYVKWVEGLLPGVRLQQADDHHIVPAQRAFQPLGMMPQDLRLPLVVQQQPHLVLHPFGRQRLLTVRFPAFRRQRLVKQLQDALLLGADLRLGDMENNLGKHGAIYHYRQECLHRVLVVLSGNDLNLIALRIIDLPHGFLKLHIQLRMDTTVCQQGVIPHRPNGRIWYLQYDIGDIISNQNRPAQYLIGGLKQFRKRILSAHGGKKFRLGLYQHRLLHKPLLPAPIFTMLRLYYTQNYHWVKAFLTRDARIFPL